MKASSFVSLVAALMLAAIWAQPASAEAKKGVLNLVFTVIDLVYRVEDLGGGVVDLKVKETATEIRINLAADVLFDFDKAIIRPKAKAALARVAALIRQKGKGVVRIDGHTDAKGSDKYNQRLSKRRAAAVRTWLVKKEGLVKTKFKTRGLGERKPVARNTKPDGSDDPEGRQKNRRVEIVIRRK